MDTAKVRLAFRLLSLDQTVPYYESMGLRLSNPKQSVSVLRSLVAMERGQPADATVSTFFAPMIDRLKTGLGEKDSAILLDWIDRIFEYAPGDDPNSNAWLSILIWSAQVASRWGELGLPVATSHALKLEFRKAASDQDINESHAQQKLKPMSTWDAEAFARGEFDDDFLDPFNWIVNTVGMVRFKQWLTQLVGQLTESEIDIFWQAVQRIGLENGLTKIENLPSPGQLIKARG